MPKFRYVARVGKGDNENVISNDIEAASKSEAKRLATAMHPDAHSIKIEE